MLSDAMASQRLGFDISAIEQGSDEWKMCRLACITASRVGDILTEPKSKKDKDAGVLSGMAETYMMDLIAEVCTGRIPDEIPARPLLWGKKHEEAARFLFEFENDLTTTQPPIYYKDESMRCACSPDGMCSDGRGLELKSPYTSSQYVKFRLGGIEAVKKEYMAQVQYSMWVAGCDQWWFSNYDPRMRRENMHSIIIDKDNEFQDAFDLKIPQFIKTMDEALDALGFKFGDQWGSL
ncbi:TPA: YqaJ viral recombinase family protein [Yersinia enterocolitica]|nr:YqaJ viral recombinase family protein [Yersinia enterocolitica]HDW8040615.1 YqaJ viral recombinase family protein [Yersinia enterocolitica]HEF7241267.1 YqaJ viral recombinase family protein [Yersinia enterocolitica]HEM6609029.1 YqaJ viral recombinase family protein [Yersinia enterocolitica]